MKYYYAKNRDPFDFKTVNEFQNRCPEGYYVKKDYYEVTDNRNSRRGKWFFYYYCKDGAEINHYKMDSFMQAAESSVGILFSDSINSDVLSKERERIKDLYLKESPTVLEKARIKSLEKAIKGTEWLLDYGDRILDEKYDVIWDNIAGFCTLISVDANYYVYSFYDSDSIRNRLTVYFSSPSAIQQVFNCATCLYFVINYCDENNIAVTQSLFELILQRINDKDEQTSFGTTAFLLIEEIKRKQVSEVHSTGITAQSPSQMRTLNFCPKCGAKLNSSDSFCPTCGCKVE